MAINITTQSLFPVRRDKQIPIIVGVAGSSGSSVITNSSGGSVDLTGYITESSLNIGVPPTMADFFWNAGKLEVNFPTSLSGFVKETSLGSHFKWTSGLLNVSDYISKTQVDASLNNTWNIASYVNTSSYYDSSLNLRLKDTSLNMTKFKWVSGLLEPSVGTGTGDVTKVYVDGSLAARDARIAAINASLGDEDNILSYVNSSTYYDGSLNARVLKSGDTMTGDLFINGGSFRVSNARGFEGTNTSGITRRIFQLYNDNNVYMDAADGDFIMRTKFGGSVAEIARFKGTTQFLGVGTNNPTVRLAVSGDASISGTLYGASNKAEKTYVDASLNAKANKNATISYKTANYEVSTGDNNFIIEASGTFNMIFPTAIDAGFQTTVVNIGGGTITMVAKLGARILTKDSSTKLTKRYTGATAYNRGSNQWVIMGDLN